MDELNFMDSSGWPVRVALVVGIVVVMAGGLMAIRWQLGDMLAYQTDPTNPDSLVLAETAARWAPGNPAVHRLAAMVEEDSVTVYENALQLAPNDYRWQIEFGRLLEQEGQSERAEAAFRRAVELAPNYADARWSLGNFYLRQNRVDSALAELRQAARDNQPYRDQVMALAWDYFQRDAMQVRTLVGETPDALARLAYFFARRGRAEDALGTWNSISETDKQANPEIAKTMAHGFYDKGNFPESLEFSRQLGLDPDARPQTVTNSSFEKGIGEAPDSRFNWRIIRNDPKLDIATDPRVKRLGNRSARLTFKNYVKPELYNLSQMIVVEPGVRYSLRFWLRTENLRSGGQPLIEIVSGNDNRQIARSEAFATGTNDWREMSVDFTAPADCTGVLVRTSRAVCGEDCPITGVLWYDDFELRRIGS